ncbi:lipopolysaccharide biosynthesis protein [bacterium]|nr:lipopolysaccharide biosynthesis protein [bacterium]
MSALRHQLLREGAWSAVGNGLAALGTLVGVRLLTEVIEDQAVYGTIALLIGYVTLGINLFTAPFTLSAQRFHSQAALKGEVGVLRVILTQVLRRAGALLVLAILTGGAIFSVKTGFSYWPFIFLAGYGLLMVFRQFEMMLFNAARRQKAVAIWYVLEAWGKPAIALLLVVFLGEKSGNVILGYLLALIGLFALFRILKVEREGTRLASAPISPDHPLRREIRRYAIPLVPLQLVSWVNSQSDRYVIGLLLGTAAVGVYAPAYGGVGMPFLVAGGTIAMFMRPPYFQAVSAGDKRLEKKLFWYWLVLSCGVVALGVALVALLKNWIVLILLAEDYRAGAAPLMPWIAGGIAFQVISQVFEAKLFAYKRPGLWTLTHVIGAVVCVVAVFLMTRRFGLLGAAMACPIYYAVMVLCAALFSVWAEKHDGKGKEPSV